MVLAAVPFFFLALGALAWFFGYDSRDGQDWRSYDEALRVRLGNAPTSR